MDTKGPRLSSKHIEQTKSHIEEAAADLLKEGKKFANALYEDGADYVGATQDTVKALSTELVKKVQKNPLASVLIAAGVGFVLSSMLRRR